MGTLFFPQDASIDESEFDKASIGDKTCTQYTLSQPCSQSFNPDSSLALTLYSLKSTLTMPSYMNLTGNQAPRDAFPATFVKLAVIGQHSNRQCVLRSDVNHPRQPSFINENQNKHPCQGISSKSKLQGTHHSSQPASPCFCHPTIRPTRFPAMHSMPCSEWVLRVTFAYWI